MLTSVSSAALPSFSLCSENTVGDFAASCCCKAEGLKVGRRISAVSSQEVENKAAPKSGAGAVSAQQRAGCNWPVETQIRLFKL